MNLSQKDKIGWHWKWIASEVKSKTVISPGYLSQTTEYMCKESWPLPLINLPSNLQNINSFCFTLDRDIPLCKTEPRKEMFTLKHEFPHQSTNTMGSEAQ